MHPDGGDGRQERVYGERQISSMIRLAATTQALAKSWRSNWPYGGLLIEYDMAKLPNPTYGQTEHNTRLPVTEINIDDDGPTRV